MYVPASSLVDGVPGVAVTFRLLKPPIVAVEPDDVPAPVAAVASASVVWSVVSEADIGTMFVNPDAGLIEFTRFVCVMVAVVLDWLQ